MKILLLLLLIPVLWITLLMMVRTTIASSSAIIAKPNCANRCGNVTVPYPFGIDNPSCAKNEFFLFECNRTTNTLFFVNIPILNISLENGTITGNIDSSFDCYYPDNATFNFNQSIDLRNWEVFTISPTHNKLGGGYRCLCETGFRGNPYLPEGCQDIVECNEPENYPCQGKCINSIGNYTCKCSLGMSGDGKVGCNGVNIITITTAIGGAIFVVITIILISILFQRRRKEKYFKENGGLILKHQRIKIFSEAELVKATNNYDHNRFLGEGGFGSVYKGVLDDKTLVAVKKAKGVDKASISHEFQHEMAIVSQVNHKNVANGFINK